jgi:hypothetical protein
MGCRVERDPVPNAQLERRANAWRSLLSSLIFARFLFP